MSIGIVLQARMGSTRLPGKVLRPLDGIAMLDRIVARLAGCRSAPRLVVATTREPADDAVAQRAGALGVAVFRGDTADVLDRYLACARAFGFADVVRATADNPFVDAGEADRLVHAHKAAGADYSVTVGLPVGVGVEVFTVAALERSWREGQAPHHREHVNEHILENPEAFAVLRLAAPPDRHAPALRLTVDTPADAARAEALIRAFRAETGGTQPTTHWLLANARETARP